MADTVSWRSGISALTLQRLQLLLKVTTSEFIAETATAQNLSVLFVRNTRPLSYAVTCWLDPGQAGDHLLTLLQSRRRDIWEVTRLSRVNDHAETKEGPCCSELELCRASTTVLDKHLVAHPPAILLMIAPKCSSEHILSCVQKVCMGGV